MELTKTHSYDAPIDAVVAMLRDDEATRAKYERMGHHDVEVIDCSGDDTHLRVETSRFVDVELPSFARRVLKPTNTMHQTDEWQRTEDGGWEGTFTIDVSGSPVHLSGTTKLTPGDGSCTEEIITSVSVKVPIIGGKIADWAAKGEVSRSVEAEFTFGDEWLAAHKS
jgi:hypothetical protein